MGKKGRLTVFEQAQKELRRIERLAKKAIERGYQFGEFPFLLTKKGTPRKRWTKKLVEALKKINRQSKLYKYAVVKPTIQKAPSIARTIIDNYVLDQSQWVYMSDADYAKLQRWIARKISDLGEVAVADAIEEAMRVGELAELKRDYKTPIQTRLDVLEAYLADAYYEKQEREFEEYQNNLDVSQDLPFNFDENDEFEETFR